MNALVQGKFFSVKFRKTEKGGYHELRITQKNENGINTEVFPVFDEELVNSLSLFNDNDTVTLDCEVYLKNGYLQKKINNLIDLSTGEKIA